MSCHQEKDVTFDYEFLKSDSGILIKNYQPTTLRQLTVYLDKVTDTVKMKELKIFIQGDNIQKINPNFKRNHYAGQVGKSVLASTKNDTLKAMMSSRFYIGDFKNRQFIKFNAWDSSLFDNRFLKKE